MNYESHIQMLNKIFNIGFLETWKLCVKWQKDVKYM